MIMNRDEAKKLIRETFEAPFDRSRFTHLIRNLFNRIEDSPKLFNKTYVAESFREYIDRYERIGKYTDSGGQTIDILAVYLERTTSLERARSMQRNFVARYLDGGRGELRDAAVVAFVSPDSADWRFSLVRMDYRIAETETGRINVKTELTPARRYSFLVGEHENTHTAQKQLIPLLESEEAPRLADFEAAFNIEVVSREFFEKYRGLFHDVTDALDKIVKTDPKIRADFDKNKIGTVDFAKKLLGQVVFLYFLQKKGWFGVARDAAWGTGPRNFLRQLFEGKHGSYANFFNDLLEPLFYEALAAERTDDFYSRFNCKIPFLNGGLFDPLNGYDWVHTDILLPNDLFSNAVRTDEGDIGCGILDIFDRYNFTVKEDEPLEKDVAVDPEMLGKVFENLLEVRDRKSKGTYYTPREIVHYMCQESLIDYLSTGIGEAVAREEIATLIRHGELAIEHDAVAVEKKKGDTAYRGKYGKTRLPATVIENASAIDERLANIRVCDPAIGSGAFPVGMMSEIVRARNVLTNFLPGKARTIYDFKRHAIRNCLYGVDIDPGAIEIAKLRLWLSLVVDEGDRQQIKPLPNLDYKIVRGNSLLGVEKDIFNDRHFKQLEELKPLFFNETNTRKKQSIKKQIDDLILTITKNNATFDFEVYFSEVWHAKGGFDVVIGNPPYVRQEQIKDIKPLLQKYDCYTGTADLYVYFYERAVRILRDGGGLAFITSNKYFRAGYGEKLRGFLSAGTHLQQIIDFGDAPVFDAITYPCIVILRKAGEGVGAYGNTPLRTADDKVRVFTWRPGPAIERFAQEFAAQGSWMAQSDLPSGGWRLEGPTTLRLLDKLRKAGTPLGEYVKGRFYRGILTGLNEAFVVDRAARDRLIAEHKSSAEILKPFLRGRDVKRWRCEFAEQYLLFIPWHFPLHLDGSMQGPSKEAERQFKKGYPAIYEHLDGFRKELSSRNKAETGIRYEWYALQRWGAEYWQEFERRKIIYPDIYEHQSFAWDEAGFFSVNTTYFIPTDRKWLTALLNSRCVEWLYSQISSKVRGGYLRAFSDYMEQIPIPSATSAQQAELERLVDRILKAKKAGASSDVSPLEREINEIVYGLFGLATQEVGIICDGQ